MTTLRALLLALLALPALWATQAWAEAWPQRSVKFIVPLGPGSGADIGARLLADRLPARWGKPVVIENRPGADGLVAIQAFVAANDDHTLLFTPSGSFTVHPFQYEKLPYAPEDLVPIARLSNTIMAVGVPESAGITTLAEFVARARAEPGKFNFAAVPGIGEFTFDYFVKTAGLRVAKVPYRDIVQAANDLGENRLQIYSSSYAILRPQREAGRIVVLAAAAWSREIGGIPAGHLPPVRPIKGQMLALSMDPENPLLRHVIWLPRGYLVPRRDGRLVVGGTVEERGFDDRITAGGLLALIEGAWRAVPGIEELPVAETWVGFRPGSRDDAPMLGPSGIDGLVIATGHHRNGSLLMPVTAEAMSAFVLTGHLPEAVRPFTPERFSNNGRHLGTSIAYGIAAEVR